MDTKFLIFSDLHLHPHAGDWRKLNDGIEVLKWILVEARSRGIKKVFFLGDFFHSREKIFSLVISQSMEIIRQFDEASIDLYLITGNHDMPLKNTAENSILQIFKEFKNVKVITDPEMIEIDNYQIFMVPYIEGVDKFCSVLDDINKRRDRSKKNYLFTHLDIVDAWYNSKRKSDCGIDVKMLADWDMVILGHYHGFQKVKSNIWYVGSPMQISFGETNIKGIMQHDDGKFDFIQNTKSPLYMYIKPDEIDERINNNYISLEADKIDKMDEYRQKILLFNPRDLEIELKALEEKGTESTPLQSGWDTQKNIESLAEFWVKSHATDVYDKNKLMKIGLEIIQKVNSEAK